MEITRVSMLTGVERTKDLDITEEQLVSYYEGGLLLQDAFPNLDPSDREFIKTGITDTEWDETFHDY
jgi:hypothetical protein